MQVRVGTSGWSFKEWKGKFYPAGLPDDQQLAHYATNFSAVEVNNTFYRMPKEKVLIEWSEQVPTGFRFALKASQRITHHSRLKDVGDNVAYFLRVSNALGDKRGPSLFQLPPNLKKDLPLLVDFLALLPPRWRATIEFRHQSWFSDDVYDALKAKDVALCIAEQEDFAVPPIATATWGYLRLHRPAYEPVELDTWASTVKGFPWDEAYVFFKHDEAAGSGPEGAAEFGKLVGG
jgi:uncharacterized protein YecE (DUF72 family)